MIEKFMIDTKNFYHSDFSYVSEQIHVQIGVQIFTDRSSETRLFICKCSNCIAPLQENLETLKAI